jgi:hypothetical protein
MGVIQPKRKRSGVYFGCGGAACLGLIFWAIVACCFLLTVVGLSTEVNSGDSERISAFWLLRSQPWHWNIPVEMSGSKPVESC